MTRIDRKCLFVSIGLHTLLVGILVLAPAYSPRVSEAPVLEILPSEFKLTFDGTVRGGNPPPGPAHAAPATLPSPAKPAEPLKPAPKPPAETEPKIERKPEPAPKVKVAEETKRVAPKAQDEEARKKPVPKKDQLATGDLKSPMRGVKVSTAKISTGKVVAPDAERLRHEKAQRDAEAAERERRRQSIGNIARTLHDVRGSLDRGLSNPVDIGPVGPGGGGPVFADYFAYLQTFYQAQWNRRKPANVSASLLVAKARVTIARGGMVTAAAIYDSSGSGAVDDSVRRVLDENKQLKPLPADSPGGEITVTITFKVEGDSST